MCCVCNSLLHINKSLNESKFKSKWIAQKKFPPFVISAFNSDEVWSNTDVLMDCYFKPLKRTKTFHYTEIVNYKIHGNLQSPGCPCHSSSANENKDKSKFFKPEHGKSCWERYEFQCERSGTTIKVLPAMCKKNDLEEHLYFWSMSQMINIYIYIYIYITNKGINNQLQTRWSKNNISIRKGNEYQNLSTIKHI